MCIQAGMCYIYNFTSGHDDVISTEQNNYRNVYRKKCTIKLKPCMYSCRDVLHPKYGILQTLNRLLFNENDKQFQCGRALLHNHTTFMCKSNHTNECNTITSEVVSMITTLSDLFRLNIKWVANRILCRQPFRNFEEKKEQLCVSFLNEHTSLFLICFCCFTDQNRTFCRPVSETLVLWMYRHITGQWIISHMTKTNPRQALADPVMARWQERVRAPLFCINVHLFTIRVLFPFLTKYFAYFFEIID